MNRVVVAMLLVVAAATFALTFQSHEGYFGPIVSADGGTVTYVQRNSAGFVWGLGIMSFTPPAHVLVLSDAVRLCRLDVRSGRSRTLRSWPQSPIVGRVLDTYRGGLFATLDVGLRADSSHGFDYRIALTVPRVPTSDMFGIQGRWRPGTGAVDHGWKRAWSGPVVSEPVLGGGAEIMTAPGSESFPSAIVAYESSTGRVRPLRRNAEYLGRYPRGVPPATLEERAQRRSIERVDTLKRVLAEAIARFRSEGVPENDAHLRAIHEMELRGYYPRSAHYVARRLVGRSPTTDSPPLFDISEEEFRAGLFQDLERAIDAPGEEIDHSFGPYVVHQGFATSARLNAFLDGGGRVFRVRRGDAIYEVTLVPRSPPRLGP